MFNLFKKTPEINFECDNWAVRKYAPITPASNFLPTRFKNLPAFVDKQTHMIDSIKTVKACPGIKDYLSLGYVIPAWCDMEFTPQGDNIFGRYSDPTYNNAIHSKEQIGDFLEKKYRVRTPLKLDNPWRTWSKKGWSILYLPMFYHEDVNFEAMPGIIDHDVGGLHSPINVMLKENKYTFIKQGDPLVQMIPIKRDPVLLRTGNASELAWIRNNAITAMHKMTFKGWTKYVKEKKTYKIKHQDTDLPE